MKKIIYSALVALAFVGVSCSSDDNSSNGGENGGVTPPNKKILVIDKININSTDNYDGKPDYQTSIFLFKYENKKLITMESEENDLFYKFSYDDKGIVKDIESTEIEDTYEGEKKVTKKHIVSDFLGVTPFNLGKIGKVNQMDKGNAVDMTFYSYDETDKVIGEYKSTMRYDTQPFAAFHTLNTTGAVDLSKKTQVDFGVNAGAFNGVDYLNKLLPVNNPTYLKHALVGSEEYVETTIAYKYDKDNYPTSFEYTIIDHVYEDDWNPITHKVEYKWVSYTIKGNATITYKELK
ncbi:hypothetical protein [Myroides sp. N17-2]|uniref:hypothetical protein n=1 Tax=Myroides sp. N17-2 TaxID=2030799 RepID=UPI000EFA66B0|nr:hypothetical protein [Myroides sp. N17-2]